MPITDPIELAGQKTFEDARLETLECGFLLACYQTLLLAMRDRRLHYKHRAVLAVLIEHMNRKTGMTWIGRERIAGELGLRVETVSNTLRELTRFGYVLAENRRTPETSNRSLRHYTLAGLSKAEIEQRLTDAISSIKASGPKAVTAVASSMKVTARSDFESHRPQCLSVDLENQKSPPAVDESHRRQWTVTNKEELVRKNSGERVFSTAAHAREETPQPGGSALVGFASEGREVSVGADAVSAILARLEIANPTKAQRAKVAETLEKAALRWKGMGGRHNLYQTASDWLVAEWLPRLRVDLDKLGEAQHPRRFRDNLERSILVDVRTSTYGSETKVWSLTRCGVNAALDEADTKWLGESLTTLADFEKGKLSAKSQEHLAFEIAKAALVRVYGDGALEVSPAELADFERRLVADGFPSDDVHRVVKEFSEAASINLKRSSRFESGTWRLLFKRKTFAPDALARLRAALAAVAAERERQKQRWLEDLPREVARAEAKWCIPFASFSKMAVSPDAECEIVSYIADNLGPVGENDVAAAMIRARELAEQFIADHKDQVGYAFRRAGGPAEPPEPFEFRWSSIEKYPEPVATSELVPV